MSLGTPLEVITGLGRLSGAEIPQAIGPFVEAFDMELRHFMEVGLLMEPASLSVITLGHGEAFGDRVAALLDRLGLGDSPRESIAELQATLDTWMLVRVGGDTEERPEVDLYFRRPRPLDETVEWLAAHGVNEAEQQALRDLGRLAGADQTGIFGAAFRHGEPVLFKAYVQTRPTPGRTLGDRLHHIFEHFRIPGLGWQAMLSGLDDLGEASKTHATVSLLLGDGDAFDSLKLDLFHVDLARFTSLARTAGILSLEAPSVVDLGRSLGLSCAEHCGFRFDNQGNARLTVYLGSNLAAGRWA
jgi:hypothetical protein